MKVKRVRYEDIDRRILGRAIVRWRIGDGRGGQVTGNIESIRIETDQTWIGSRLWSTMIDSGGWVEVEK